MIRMMILLTVQPVAAAIVVQATLRQTVLVTEYTGRELESRERHGLASGDTHI